MCERVCVCVKLHACVLMFTLVCLHAPVIRISLCFHVPLRFFFFFFFFLGGGVVVGRGLFWQVCTARVLSFVCSKAAGDVLEAALQQQLPMARSPSGEEVCVCVCVSHFMFLSLSR